MDFERSEEMEINKLELGNRIRNVRNKRLESMEKFGQSIADATNNQSKSGKSNVSRWERGENIPNNETLKAIADLGGISVNYLLYGDLKSRIISQIEMYIAEKNLNLSEDRIKEAIDNLLGILKDETSNENIRLEVQAEFILDIMNTMEWKELSDNELTELSTYQEVLLALQLAETKLKESNFHFKDNHTKEFLEQIDRLSNMIKNNI